MPDQAYPGFDDEPLPAELLASLRQARADGVSLSLDLDSPRGEGRLKAIHWRPGDRNALAEIIMEDCRYPVKLTLAGQEFIITPWTLKSWEALQ